MAVESTFFEVIFEQRPTIFSSMIFEVFLHLAQGILKFTDRTRYFFVTVEFQNKMLITAKLVINRDSNH